MKVYSRLFSYVSKYKGRLIAGIFLSFFVSIFNGASLTTLIPIFDSLGAGDNYKFQFTITKKDLRNLELKEKGIPISRLEEAEILFTELKLSLNSYFQTKTPDELVLLFSMIVFPIYFLKLLSLAGTVYFINSAGLLAVRDIRNELYKKLLKLPLIYFVHERTGILMSRVINDVETTGKIVSNDLKDGINDSFYIITHLILLFLLSWKLAILVFIIIPLIMGPVSAFSDKIRKATKSQQERLSNLYGDLQEVVTGIRVIRAFSQEKRESERFYKVNDDLNKKTFKGHFYHQIGPTIVDFTASLMAMLFLAIGAYLMDDSGFSRGVFLAFFLTLIFIMRPIKQLSMLYNMSQSSLAAAERVFSLLDERVDIVNPEKPIFLKKMNHGIEFKNVYYHYPNSDTPALSNINLKIEKNSTIALVGQSGAGKSTLIDLIPRLIDPGSGAVYMDGIDLRNLDLKNLRSKIAVVSQNIFLFNGTVRDNIAYGSPNATDKEIIEAAEKAFATEFIYAFDDGFQTFIGERGVMLSGGQRQRISIARALLRDPEILILDEATSALDTESERFIQDALTSLYINRTVIIIAHRLSTVKIADQIYVMEKGKIVEQGNHNELIAINGTYKKLHDFEFQFN